MRITVLSENTVCRTGLTPEHGLSLYIETGTHRILFDMGQSALFLSHAKLLGIDIADVDVAVLSHGHYDHGGGLSAFLAANRQATVYVSAHAFEPHFRGDGTDIGLDTGLKGCDRLHLVGDCHEIDGTLSLFSCNEREKAFALDTAGLRMGAGEGTAPEDFRHEQYLLVREGERRILISGCSHKGILNIATWFKPHVLVGGFHLNKNDPSGAGRSTLDHIADTLLRADTHYYTCHCTGVPQYDYLKAKMQDRLQYLSCGAVLEV